MKLKSSDLNKMGLVLKDGVLQKNETIKKKTVRIKESLGSYKFNDGLPSEPEVKKYSLDKRRKFYAFDVVPLGKPRMTQSDKWKTNPEHPDPDKRKREVVHNYHLWQNRIRMQAEKMNFNIGKSLEAVFFIPMPESWSKSKKEKLLGMPCEEKPDTDNIIKAICDTFSKEDKSMWWIKCEKRWAYYGSIIIFQ